MRHFWTGAFGTGVLLLLLAFHRPIRAPIVIKLSDFFKLATYHHLSCDCETDHSCGRKAQYLSPDVLLSRPYPPAPSNASVPKLIHQSWPSNQMPPPDVQFGSETWRINHPNWEWVLWREEDNQRLVDLRFPWFKNAYAQLDTADSKVAVARYLYMYAFGGYFPSPRVNSLILRIYADVDVECLHSFDPLLLEHVASSIAKSVKSSESQSGQSSVYQFAYFGHLGVDTYWQELISNTWMASTANHPFFLLPLEAMDRHSADSSEYLNWGRQLTGSQALRTLIQWYEAGYDGGRELVSNLHSASINKTMFETFNVQHSITVFPSGVIFPLSWSSHPRSRHKAFARKMHTNRRLYVQ